VRQLLVKGGHRVVDRTRRLGRGATRQNARRRVGWRNECWRRDERRRVHLEVGKRADVPKIVENRDPRYVRRMELGYSPWAK